MANNQQTRNLYRELLGASLSKDLSRSCQILREIVETDPEDAYAREQLQAVGGTLCKDHVPELEAAISRQDAAEIARLVAEFRGWADEAWLVANVPAFARAVSPERASCAVAPGGVSPVPDVPVGVPVDAPVGVSVGVPSVPPQWEASSRPQGGEFAPPGVQVPSGPPSHQMRSQDNGNGGGLSFLNVALVVALVVVAAIWLNSRDEKQPERPAQTPEQQEPSSAFKKPGKPDSEAKGEKKAEGDKKAEEARKAEEADDAKAFNDDPSTDDKPAAKPKQAKSKEWEGKITPRDGKERYVKGSEDEVNKDVVFEISYDEVCAAFGLDADRAPVIMLAPAPELDGEARAALEDKGALDGSERELLLDKDVKLSLPAKRSHTWILRARVEDRGKGEYVVFLAPVAQDCVEEGILKNTEAAVKKAEAAVKKAEAAVKKAEAAVKKAEATVKEAVAAKKDASKAKWNLEKKQKELKRRQEDLQELKDRQKKGNYRNKRLQHF